MHHAGEKVATISSNVHNCLTRYRSSIQCITSHPTSSRYIHSKNNTHHAMRSSHSPKPRPKIQKAPLVVRLLFLTSATPHSLFSCGRPRWSRQLSVGPTTTMTAFLGTLDGDRSCPAVSGALLDLSVTLPDRRRQVSTPRVDRLQGLHAGVRADAAEEQDVLKKGKSVRNPPFPFYSSFPKFEKGLVKK